MPTCRITVRSESNGGGGQSGIGWQAVVPARARVRVGRQKVVTFGV